MVIDENEIVEVILRQAQAVEPVRGRIHIIALEAQERSEEIARHGIVLDE
jgi:hypothetical protein